MHYYRVSLLLYVFKNIKEMLYTNQERAKMYFAICTHFKIGVFLSFLLFYLQKFVTKPNHF